MASTTFVNGTTLTDADWFNDVDALVYDIFNEKTSAGTSGTILRSNGTNIVNTTTTYPATMTANRLLYGSGSNAISESGSGLTWDGTTLAATNVSVGDGSAVTPSVKVGDEQNGLYSPAANQLAVSLGGTVAMDMSSSQMRFIPTNAGATTAFGVVNTSDTASSDAKFFAQVAGASGGDAFLHILVNGVQNWVAGLDNSDSDSFVISRSSVPGTNNAVRIDTTGALQTGGTSAAATGYASNGDLTLPSTGKVRALNTAKAHAYITYSAGTPSVQGGGWNVGSLTDTGTGDVLVAITNAMADTNYTAVFGSDNAAGFIRTGTRNTTSVQIVLLDTGGSAADRNFSMALFGN